MRVDGVLIIDHCLHRTIVVHLEASGDFQLKHLEKRENWSIVTEADLYYITVS